MFTFVQVSKDAYPYSTLHIDTCGVLKRARFTRTLDIEQVRRLDSVRMDYCTKCIGKTHIGVGGQTEYSEARQEFWAIQRAFKDDQSAQWQRVHLARKVVALRLALEEAEALIDPTDAMFATVLATTDRDARSGGYTPLEVTVARR